MRDFDFFVAFLQHIYRGNSASVLPPEVLWEDAKLPPCCYIGGVQSLITTFKQVCFRNGFYAPK